MLKITCFWLRKKNTTDRTVVKQSLELFKVILNQNYFQCDGKYFKSMRCIPMGSPVSVVVVELYLQYFEEFIN